MSLSFRYRDRDGNDCYYFLPFNPLFIIAMMGLAFSFAIHLLVAFRNLVHHSPLSVALAIGAALGIGFGSFAVAKMSVIRSGTLVSIGPRMMSAAMRRCYLVGYMTMVCGGLFAGLFTLVAL